MTDTNTKPTNPKDAVGTNKMPMSFVPAPVIAELGVAMLEGGLKYARHNYRAVGVRASVYYDATMRHLMSFWEGENIDPDSGLSHITKAIASLVVLRDSMMLGNWVDDRPPRAADGWIVELNARAKALVEKYPNPKAPFTQVECGVGQVATGDVQYVAHVNKDPLPPLKYDAPVGWARS